MANPAPSNPAPYQAPASVGSPETMPARQRPTGVTVFGILSILFGLLGFVGTLFTTAFMVFGAYLETGPNPVFEAMEESLGFAIYSYVSVLAGAAFAILLVIAGIGMLKMTPWSRKLSVVYSLYAILSAVVGLIINISIVFAPALGEARSGPEQVGAVVGLTSVVFGTVIGAIYPIALLIYCWRRPTIAMFESWR